MKNFIINFSYRLIYFNYQNNCKIRKYPVKPVLNVFCGKQKESSKYHVENVYLNEGM